MFGDVVLSIPRVAFESALTEMKRARGVATDAELTATDLRQLCDAYQKVYSDSGKTFPADPETQLKMAIEAVFASWNNDRAVKYREINKDCAGLKGTAVNVQSVRFIFISVWAIGVTTVLFTDGLR
jgi:pyruvate,orthophosphate dikinase